ncbi:MAG TPA: heavy metal-binding domain-containing protein [Pseudonocardia sp.]|uniref:heavy metal-binding domain-containing protein n=1 Tax=Pseudonocardia sp. TaxID=60912 RepID=UPI002ED88FBA
MADWDGRGLPPVAAARMARFASSGLRTSLLTVPGAAGVESVGLRPVGEVMGCIVEHIGFAGWQGCGYYGGFGAGGFGAGGFGGAGFGGVLGGGGVRGGIPGTFGGGIAGGMPSATVTSSAGGYSGYRPYVDALYHGYRTAIARMVLEARGMGADGVVGVRLRVDRMEGSNREFVALGTAVRAESASRPAQVFTTELAGQDVAKLLRAGWVPAGIALGISVAIRHDDWTTRRQASWGTGNVEVSGYTDLITHVRADARARFQRDIRELGADGAVASDISLSVWEIEPAENHRDHVAESMMLGTAVARFHTASGPPTRSLSILPLRSASPHRRTR